MAVAHFLTRHGGGKDSQPRHFSSVFSKVSMAPCAGLGAQSSGLGLSLSFACKRLMLCLHRWWSTGAVPSVLRGSSASVLALLTGLQMLSRSFVTSISLL